jgi:hypothetical protein
MSEHEEKTVDVDDLEEPVADESAERVKGGAGEISVAPAPTLVKTINPRVIVPCV